MFSSRKSAAPAAAGGYNLTKSLRFRSSASAYLNRTPASAGNRKTWTWSGWVKRGALGVYSPLFIAGTTNGQQVGSLAFSSAGGVYDKLELNFGVQGTSTEFWLQTTQVFRDPSAWYHIVCAVDTTQATASNRVKFYVNGTQITALSSYGGYSQYPSQNYNTSVNNTVQHLISRDQVNTAGYFDGYLAEVNFIDGQALTPSSFGETSAATGVWQPIRYTGTYGTNGFYLDFEDTSSVAALGYDAAGSNDWTVNNVSLTSGATYDSMKDVPTLTNTDTANYAVLNRLNQNSYITLTNGNLTATSSTNDVAFVASNIAMPGGDKYYFEITCQTSIGANFYQAVGIWGTDQFSSYGGSYSTYYSYNAQDGTKYNNGTSTSYGATWTTGDVIGVAVDLVNGTLTFYKNGTSQGTAFTGLSTSISYYASIYCYTTQAAANFGQRPFAYTPPSGFKALNTFNLPTPTIGATASTQAGKYMNPVLFTGNSSGASVTGVGFQPDFVWMKCRSTARNHELLNAVTGGSSTLFSNLTNAEATDQRISSFNSDGFTYTTNSNSANTGDTYVAWNWKANGSGSTNTSGSITSTVSVNTSAGFSIVTYTGTGSTATVGHGLGVAPSFIIAKARNSAQRWTVYTAALGNGYYGYLNETFAFDTANASLRWNTAPTSSVFGVGTSVDVNNNTTTYVAYCFAEVAGYSRFGSYTGNGSTDGTFVYTGFRPAFILVKRTDSTGNWCLFDNKRLGYNGASASKELYPNLSLSEGTSNGPDQLSNGFKFRDTYSDVNGSGATYIYMAFAENPFKYSNAR